MICFLLIASTQKICEKNRNDTSYVRAIALFKSGQYLSAQKELEKFLTNQSLADPKFIQEVVLLGAVLVELSKYKAAQVLLESCVQMFRSRVPQDHRGLAFALMYLGKAYAQRGAYKTSERVLRESIALYNGYGEERKEELICAQTLLAETYLFSEQYKSAEKCFQNIIEALVQNNPKMLWIKLKLGRLYMLSCEYEKARKLFEDGIQCIKIHFPNDKATAGWCLTYLGDIYRHLDMFKESEKAIQEGMVSFKACGYREDHQVIQWCKFYLSRTHCAKNRYLKEKQLHAHCEKMHDQLYGRA